MTPLKNEQGFSLIVTLFVMLMLVGLTAASQHMSQGSLATARNYRSATQAFYAAEAGVRHAVALINDDGVTDLTAEVINAWPGQQAPFGEGSNRLADGLYEYTVAILPDPYSADTNRGLLVSTGRGSDDAIRTVSAHIIRSGIGDAPPGAMYIAADDPAASTFNGNAFLVNGNDVYFGVPGPAPPVPGIAAQLDENADAVRDSLNSVQSDNVQGLGYIDDPVTASVAATRAPSVAEVNAMIDDLLALPHVEYAGKNIVGTEAFGTVAAPQITYCSDPLGVTIRGAGAASGVGILIVDGDLTVQGDLDFQGMILVRGAIHVTGNLVAHGSIWTTGLALTAGGAGLVQYSSQALALAGQSGGGGAGTLAAPVVITAWRDQF